MHTSSSPQRVVEYRDPRELRLHKALKHAPGEWADTDPRFEALCDDIGERGIDQPLLITAADEIAEGRHRWRGAKRQQLAQVPVFVIADADVPTVIVQSLLQRRHYTPGQRAYLLAPMLEHAFEAAHQRKLLGKRAPSGAPSALSAEGLDLEKWAHSIGVCIRLLRDAKKVWDLFQDEKPRMITDEDGKGGRTSTFREYYEPKILADEKPMGLGAVVAGIGFTLEREKKGGKHKGGKPAAVENQLRLFNEIVTDEFNRWEYWQKFDDDTKAAHFKSVRAQAAQLADAGQLEAMADYHAKLASEFRKAAREAQSANSTKN